MKLKLKEEKTLSVSVIAFDAMNKATEAYHKLMNAINSFTDDPEYKVTFQYAKECNYFGYKVCEVCTATITKIS